MCTRFKISFPLFRFGVKFLQLLFTISFLFGSLAVFVGLFFVFVFVALVEIFSLSDISLVAKKIIKKQAMISLQGVAYEGLFWNKYSFCLIFAGPS